jgi:outer membrane protein assembly factor BamE (lipoprotein component of BamABCDE complex)
MSFYKFILIIFSINYIFGCVEKTTYSGKLFNEENLSHVNILNKSDLIKNFGTPSYIDEINNQYFYYTEKNKSKNFYSNKVEYSYLFVFKIDKNDQIVNSESIDLLENDVNKYQKNKTINNIVKRGLIEKIFGGVGPNKLPNSP